MAPPTEPPPRYASDIVDPSPLARSLRFEFSGRIAPNRFMKAAMTEQLASWHKKEPHKRGIPTKALIRAYERWAVGGIGLILTGNFMIFLDHLESVGDPIIPPDAPFHGARFQAFQQLAAAGKAHGSLMVPQVSHPGRLCNNYFQQFPVAASAIPADMTSEKKPLHFNPPHEASQVEIDAIIESFAHAAEYLEKAGYDGIEIHGAHGFFLSGFLSLATNIRKDLYGGNIENRMRVILEVREAIRKRVSPSFIVGIKINSTEFQTNNFSVDDARKLCAALEDAEFDFVELSGGTAENTITEHKREAIRESTKRREAYFQEFAEKIIHGLQKTKVYITGGLRTVGGMVRALEVVDGVGLGRPLVQEFDLCRKILDGKVTGAIVPEIGAGEFWLALMAGNKIIRDVGQGKEPIKLWEKEVVAELRRDYIVWLENKSSDLNEVVEGMKQEMINSGVSGDTLDRDTIRGPQAEKLQFDRIMDFLTSAHQDGLSIGLGSKRENKVGFFIGPTIITNAPENHRVTRNEIFGRVVVINSFTNEDEVMKLANDTEYGLYASVFTKDIERAMRIAKLFEAGIVGVNCTSLSMSFDMPFGGWKGSGDGREYSAFATDAWTELKSVLVALSTVRLCCQ